MPRRWKPWLMSLLMSNMIVPLFFIANRQEAFVVFVTALLAGAVFIVLTAYSGFSRLLGFGHVPWIPLVIYLVMRLEPARAVAASADATTADKIFLIWMHAVIILDCGSLLLDAANVVRYFAGDREEMVADLSPPLPAEVKTAENS